VEDFEASSQVVYFLTGFFGLTNERLKGFVDSRNNFRNLVQGGSGLLNPTFPIEWKSN